MNTCRSCHAPIRWAVTISNGKHIPLDAHPSPAGNIRLVEGAPPHALVIGATIDLLDPTDDGVRYTSHFATCPDADTWRHE